MPTATRKPATAKKPAADPIQLLDRATSPVDRLEEEIHDKRRAVREAEQKLVDLRRDLAFVEGKAAKVAALLNNGGAVARAVEAKPFDETLLRMLKRCKQAPWVKLQRAGATDSQLSTILATGWPDYHPIENPTRAVGGYGDPRVYVNARGFNAKPTLQGKALVAEVRRLMGIPQPKPQPAHKPTPAKKTAAAAANTLTITTSVKKKPAAKKGGKGGAGGSGAAAKASAAAASKPAAAAADDADEDLDARTVESIESGGTYAAAMFGMNAADFERSMPPAEKGGLRGNAPNDDRGGHIGEPVLLNDEPWAVICSAVKQDRVVYTLQPLLGRGEFMGGVQSWRQRRSRHRDMAAEHVPLTGVEVEDPHGEVWVLGRDEERIYCEVPRPPAANDTNVVSARAADDTPVVSAPAADDTRVVRPAELGPRERVLHDALHRYEGASGRWLELRHSGATDAELRKAIAREFGNSGGGPDYSVRGGKDPAFASPPSRTKPTLKGKPLVDEVRSLMRIPTRNYSAARLAQLQAAPRSEQDAGDVMIATIPAHVGRVTLTLWPDEARGQWYCGADVDLGNLGKRVIRPLSRPAFPDRAAAIADTAGHLLDLAEREVRGLPRDKVVNGRAVVAALKRFVEDLPDPTPAAADPDEAPLGSPAWATAMGFGDQVSEQRARTIAALPADRRHLMKDARVNDAGEYHRPPAGGEEEVTRCGEAGELQLYLSRDGDGGWHAGHNLYWRRVSLGSHCERARVDGVVYEDRAEALQGELAVVLKLVDAIKGPPATKADQDDARAMGKHLRDWGRDQAKRATQAAAAIAAKAPPAGKSKPNGRGGPPLHAVAAAILASGGPLVTGVAGGPLN